MGHLPKTDSGGGYVLNFQHIRHAMESVPADSQAEIEYLVGRYQIDSPKLLWTISTSARRVHGDLIVRHRHVFGASRSGSRLRADRLIRPPVRICPHQSTTTERPPVNPYIKTARPNGPLFLYSICAALQAKGPGPIKMPYDTAFRQPTPDEKRMMNFAGGRSRDDAVFDCPRCPRRWKVDYDVDANRSEMVITVWHCFYDRPRTASLVWPGFVRRVDPIWRDNMNNEFWSKTRGFPDFEVF